MSSRQTCLHVDFDMVWDKTASNLCISLARLYVGSIEYEVKEQKAIICI